MTRPLKMFMTFGVIRNRRCRSGLCRAQHGLPALGHIASWSSQHRCTNGRSLQIRRQRSRRHLPRSLAHRLWMVADSKHPRPYAPFQVISGSGNLNLRDLTCQGAWSTPGAPSRQSLKLSATLSLCSLHSRLTTMTSGLHQARQVGRLGLVGGIGVVKLYRVTFSVDSQFGHSHGSFTQGRPVSRLCPVHVCHQTGACARWPSLARAAPTRVEAMLAYVWPTYWASQKVGHLPT